MNKNKIIIIILLLLITPIIISLILSFTGYKDVGDNKNHEKYVDTLYVPDTIDNRKDYVIKNTNYFTYVTLFGFIAISGLAYMYVIRVKNNK